MRQLITNDLFAMSRILKKLDLKLDLKIDGPDEIEGTDGLKNEKAYENIGFDLILDLIKKVTENAYMAQTEINNFFGELSGMTGEEFGKLPIKESLAIIKEFKQLDGIDDFFKSAGQLMK